MLQPTLPERSVSDATVLAQQQGEIIDGSQIQ